MKVKTYAVLHHAIEVGIEYGWNRAHKYTDDPKPSTIKEEIEFAIMNELSEWFTFDDEQKTDGT